jgi:SAM-dependent methyltransferase
VKNSMSSSDALMVKYYADRAKEYDRIYCGPERQNDLRQLRRLVERTFAGAHVLEVACGTGYWTEILAQTASSVLATDINEEVLAIARTKPIAPRKVTFLRQDAYRLAALPQRFNGGLAAFWWSHIPNVRLHSFLIGLHHVFLPGAKIVFIDNTYVEGSSTPISRTDRFGNTYQSRKLEDGSVCEVRKNFPTTSGLRTAVKGLAVNVQIEFLRYYWILTYVPRGANDGGDRMTKPTLGKSTKAQRHIS